VQQQRHDPNGEYVHRWIPELGTDRYPEPIVDHKTAVAAWTTERAAARS
jgi:deoxyribodipyrimidine photo-lyase